MAENLDIEGRRSVRTPMQWTSGVNGGFSRADPESIRRPLPSGPHGPEHVNVADQLGRQDSLLSWMQRLISRRRSTPEFGMGEWSLLDARTSRVLMIRYDWGGAIGHRRAQPGGRRSRDRPRTTHRRSRTRGHLVESRLRAAHQFAERRRFRLQVDQVDDDLGARPLSTRFVSTRSQRDVTVSHRQSPVGALRRLRPLQ